MTTEDDFHRALDAHPDDRHTRLVFADWLDDHGDERGPGYRAQGALGIAPCEFETIDGTMLYGYRRESIPWWLAIDAQYTDSRVGSHEWDTRRAAEDSAALAFARLPAERRAELLEAAPKPVGA